MGANGQSLTVVLILLFIAFVLPVVAIWMDDNAWTGRIHHKH